MKNMKIEDGLLLSDMELIYQGKHLVLKRVLVDTGSGGTILSSDLVGGSEFVYLKVIDSLKLGSLIVNDFTIEIKMNL